MKEQNIKIYRFGPIAAFDKSAHSLSRTLFSYYFSLYGIDSYLYLRSLKPTASLKEFETFLGVKFPENFHIFTTVKHKGLSTFLIIRKLFQDIYKNRKYRNFIFVSKEKHVKLLSKFKNFLNFKIVFENHEEFTYTEGVSKADLTYVVSPDVFKEISLKFPNVILWNYHYPLGDHLFLPETNLTKKNEYSLGYIGSLLPEKGLDFLMKAIRSITNVKLIVIGGNEKQIENAKKLSEKLGIFKKVIFKGFVPQSKIPESVKDVDILVSPFKEKQRTIPLKVYEYMALGKPVLCSDIDSVRVVAKDLFFYFKPQNENSFVKTLKNLLSNLEKTNEKVKKMRKYAENFRWNRVIGRVLRDLERI